MPFAFGLCAAEVARVGDEPITTEAVRQAVARNGYNIYEESSVRKALQDTVQFELMAAEARKLGLDEDPAIQRRIKELLVQKLMVEKVDGPLAAVHFSDEEVKAYYDSHTNDFRRPAIARGHVLTILIEPGKEAEAQAKASEALKEWQTVSPPIGNRQLASAKPLAQPGSAVGNPDNAAAIVKKYSDDPSEKLNGGLSNFFVEGQPGRRYPKEVEEAMLALKLRGAVAGPIATPQAVYLVALLERRDTVPTPLAQAKPEVAKRLTHERREKLLAEYCEALKKEIPVTVDESALKEAVQATKPGAGPPSVPGGMP